MGFRHGNRTNMPSLLSPERLRDVEREKLDLEAKLKAEKEKKARIVSIIKKNNKELSTFICAFCQNKEFGFAKTYPDFVFDKFYSICFRHFLDSRIQVINATFLDFVIC
jgi:hypothetical protein